MTLQEYIQEKIMCTKHLKISSTEILSVQKRDLTVT